MANLTTTSSDPVPLDNLVDGTGAVLTDGIPSGSGTGGLGGFKGLSKISSIVIYILGGWWMA